MIINITYQGHSADYELALGSDASDADIKRIALEVVRAGGVRGLHLPQLPNGAFDHYVVDRMRAPDGSPRVYLRPKVPFGAA